MSKKELDVKELENGWLEVPFSYMVENISQRIEPSQSDLDIFIGLEHLDPLSLKINRWGSPKELKGTKLLAKPGDIIFGKRNAYLRKAAVCEVDAIVSAHAMILRPREENVLKEFVYFFMQSDEFYKRSMMVSEGSISPTIKWKILSEEKFIIPNKNIQAKIVEKLKKLEGVIILNDSLLNKVYKYKEKLLGYILSKGLNNDIDNWNDFKLSDLSEIIRGISWTKEDEFDNKIDGSIRVYKIPNVLKNSRYQDENDRTYITRTDKMDKYLIKNNDLLMVSANGNPDRVGNVVKLKQVEPAVFASFLLKIEPKQNITPDFLYYILTSSRVQRKITEGSRGSTGLKNINVPYMKDIKIKIPNINEQERIVNILSNVDDTIEDIQNKIEYTKAIKSKLLEYLITFNI